MIYSCKEHIEEGLEEVIEDGGPPPELEETADHGHTCFLCPEAAAYRIAAGA
ncbi:CxxH/CxxC protein [Alkalicoccus chagannorensis]|uniref:CxxH/CxxC protein n=1 Tax=Alkalicoccus chagannorensis TaxID=427072 RepID=UPI00041CD30B|nr:CxxH/CxxC protein [Alkalicoccus chagannorensis]